MASSVSDDYEFRTLLMNGIQPDETNIRDSILSDIWNLRNRFGDSVVISNAEQIREMQDYLNRMFGAINGISDNEVKDNVTVIAERLRTYYLSKIPTAQDQDFDTDDDELDMFEPPPRSRARSPPRINRNRRESSGTNFNEETNRPYFPDLNEDEGPPRQGGRKKTKKSKKNKKSKKTKKTRKTKKTKKTRKSRK